MQVVTHLIEEVAIAQNNDGVHWEHLPVTYG
jgi:hypothetical protein